MALSAAPEWERDREDKWEYEYDDAQTEDCYFTLDLTTHVPDALTRKYDARRPPVQLLDLHTPNPLVKFDGAIYSCYWTTDLGTQFHIAHAGATPAPKRPGTVLDIIALSQARLIGKPVTLKQKNNSNARERAPTPPEADPPHNEDDHVPAAPSTLHDPTKPLVIPRDLCKDGTAEAQAAFLESLSRIKLQKGESDPVPIYSIRTHRDPRNREDLRKRALEEDSARRKDEAAIAADKPRKRRKRLTAQEKGLIPNDAASRGAAGRHDRATLGARVGFEGQGPGALAPSSATTRKRSSRRAKSAEAVEEAEVQEGGDEDGEYVEGDD